MCRHNRRGIWALSSMRLSLSQFTIRLWIEPGALQLIHQHMGIVPPELSRPVTVYPPAGNDRPFYSCPRAAAVSGEWHPYTRLWTAAHLRVWRVPKGYWKNGRGSPGWRYLWFVLSSLPRWKSERRVSLPREHTDLIVFKSFEAKKKASIAWIILFSRRW